MDGESVPLALDSIRGLLPRGGTILGTSRTNPYGSDDGPARVKATLATDGVDAVIAIGGEDTLGVAQALADGVQMVVGVPKTIDNDLSATDFTFGFHTGRADRDRCDRPSAHHGRESRPRDGRRGDGPPRGMDRDVLGARGRRRRDPRSRDAVRHPGDLRPADAPPRARRELLDRGRRGGSDAGRRRAELQSTEVDEFGHVRLGGVGNWLQQEIEKRTGYEARMTQLGHVLRGGTPTAYDRVIATRFGVEAIDAVHERDFEDGGAARHRRRARPDRSRRRRFENRRRTPLRHRRRVLRLISRREM